MNDYKQLKLIECPRDAMQGWLATILTDHKVRFLNTLLKVGFDTLDFGSFVSPKAIPQMADTPAVLDRLVMDGSRTKLLAIVANSRGAESAATYSQITYLGFPFSVSEEFQRRNTNSTIEESLHRVEEIQRICMHNGKHPVIYISMGFGNPYGEPWNEEIVINWTKRLATMGINTIALADTIGVAEPEKITRLFKSLIPEVVGVEFGAHFHSHPDSWKEKIDAAISGGCKRFDSAMKGIGGCPMAADKLVGNLATEQLVAYFGGPSSVGLDADAFVESLEVAEEIFHV
ncbi:MAG: hydroxymethylglutaryl-CoA lyase [Bacteroidota bacterium]